MKTTRRWTLGPNPRDPYATLTSVHTWKDSGLGSLTRIQKEIGDVHMPVSQHLTEVSPIQIYKIFPQDGQSGGISIKNIAQE